EHHLAGADVEGERLAQLLADDLQGGSDDGVVPRGPRGLLAPLDHLEIRMAGGRAGTVRSNRCLHGSLLPSGGASRGVADVGNGARRPWEPAWEWPWNLLARGT